MIERWMAFVAKRWGVVFLAMLCLGAVALWSAKQLRLDGDLARLLPEQAQSARNLQELEQVYGAQVGRLTLVLKGQDGEQLPDELAQSLGAALKDVEGVARVEVVDPVSELEPYRLLYLDRPDLEQIVGKLQKRIRWERQRANPLFAGLGQEAPDVDFSQIEAKYKKRDRVYYRGDRGELLVFVHPSFAASDLDASKGLVARVRARSQEVLKPRWPKVSLSLTGRYEKRVEQQALMTADMAKASGIALGLLAAFLLIYFRGFLAPLQVIVPLLFGTLLTMGLARGIFGSLNILTGFLGAILMGLGVDYGIHLVGRYHEVRRSGQSLVASLTQTFGTTGKANLYAGLTTMAALGSMMVSDFRAFKEFGVIAVMGITLILCSYLVLLPVLVVVTDKLAGKLRPSLATWAGQHLGAALDSRHARWRALMVPSALVILAALALSTGLPKLSMDETFDSLQITDTPTWQLDQRVNEILGQSQTPAVILAQDDAHAELLRQELNRRKAQTPEGYSIDRVLGVQDLLPAEQAEKRQMLESLATQIDKVPERARSEELRTFDTELRALLAKPALSLETLPSNLSTPLSRRDRRDSSVLLVLPAVELSVAKNLRAFGQVTRQLPGPTPDSPKIMATSDNQLLLDIIHLVRRDLVWMVVLTLIGLLGVTLLAFGPRRQALILFATLGVAIAGAAGALGLIGQTVNFINVLIIPIWLGLAVDASYHMLLHIKEDPEHAEGLVTTALSVSAAFATSMVGFGTLILSRHSGLASLARVALVGLGLILLVEVAAVLLIFGRAQLKRPDASSRVSEVEAEADADADMLDPADSPA